MTAAVVNVLFMMDEMPVSLTSPDLLEEVSVVDINSLSGQHWRMMKPKGAAPAYKPHYLPRFAKIEKTFGEVPQSMVTEILKRTTECYKILFVHGKVACSTLKKMLGRSTIFDLDDLFELKLMELPLTPGKECLHHHQLDAATVCTHSKAYRLVTWCKEHPFLTNMLESSARLQTFKHWNNNDSVSKEYLSSNGFMHIPNKEFPQLTECVYCGLKVYKWSKGDNVFSRHGKLSKSCTLFNFTSAYMYDFTEK